MFEKSPVWSRRTAFVIAWIVAGCNEGGAMPPPPPPPDPVVWEACPVEFLEECASLDMPLDWSRPDGPTLAVYASRTLAPEQPSTAQLWLLQGGPGGSGTDLRGMVPQLHAILPSTDVYVLEHRGVGLSGHLACSAEDATSFGGATIFPSELDGCIASLRREWGEGLEGFSTTGDAHDLARFIERTREPGRRVVVWGASYGTLRAMRLLQAHPEVADGVILDGIVVPDLSFARFYEGADAAGQVLAMRCAADPDCESRLGPDPWSRVVSLGERIAEGHCPALGMSRGDFRELGASLFVVGLSPHLLPLVHRIDRCSESDVRVVARYVERLTALLGALAGPQFSRVLYDHVGLSELWESPPPSRAEVAARWDTCTLCDDPAPTVNLAGLQPFWPRYPLDAWTRQWPDFPTPVLALNGELDMQTPLFRAETIAAHLDGPSQRFFAVPSAGHVASGLALSAPWEGEPPCVVRMMASFVEDPEAPVDGSCLATIPPPSWAGTTAQDEALFGPGAMWVDGAFSADAQPPTIDWAAFAEAARRRRWL